MSHNKFIDAAVVVAILTFGLVFHCELPQDPTDPSNTAVSPVLRNSDWVNSSQSITDTVGNTVQIGAAVNLPENLDSIRITIWAEGIPVFDTLITTFKTGRNDTVWKKLYFVTAGYKTVTVTPYSSIVKLPIANAGITIIARSGFPNNKPSIIVNESIITRPAESCSLLIQTADADVNQALTVAMTARPTSATIEGNSLFRWTPPKDFLGYDTVIFVVTDNGKPPLSDTATAIITVTATPHPPVIEVVGNRTVKPLETCTLTLHASDADAGQQLSITMAGNPDGSAIVDDSLFVWAVPAGAAGAYAVQFFVTDNGSPRLSNSTTVTITVIDATVNHAPTWSLDTLPVSLNDTASFKLQLADQCTDVDNDQLIYSLLAGLPAGDTVAGSYYSFTATSAAIGMYVAALVATDPEGTKDTFYIALAIESSATDNTPPVITLISPATDSGISTAATCTLDVICTDASNVASVSATLGGSVIPAILTDGHYLMAVSGLTPGVYTAITITATDASGNANKRTRTVYVKYSQGFCVTYSGNGNDGGTVPVDAGSYEAGATVTVKANTGSLVKTGATFAGWNTAADGSGTAYAAGATFEMGAANDTLYARWTTNPTYTVVYSGNGSTGGAVPVDAGAYEAGATVTVKANTGSLVKTGSSFAGWNTAADGSGTAFAVNATFEIGAANDTLYARWIVKQYTVTYNGNGNSGGTVPTDAVQHDSATSVTVAANSGSLTRIGYTFTGWNTAEDGSGTSYTAETGSFIIHANTTLYAKWVIKTYTLTYNGNGNGGGSVPASGSPLDSNTAVTIPGNTGGLTKMGYDFSGWNSAANGSGTSFAAGATLMVRSDTTLFAQWTVKRYTVTFNCQGGSPTPPMQTIDHNMYATQPTNPTYTGYTFGGWYKEPGCTNVWTFSNDKVTGDMRLYAKWTIIPYTVTFHPQGGSPTPTTQTVNYSGYAAEPTGTNAPSLTSYVLEGWYTESSLINKWNFDTQVFANYDLYAKWIIQDVDGNTYSEVTINGKVWMVGNLKTTQFNDKTPILEIANQSDWDNQTDQSAYCWYSKNPSTKDPYGALYNWNAVNSGKLAPKGWHVATEQEWDSLFATDHCQLMEYGTSHWEESCGNNESGFTAVGSGGRTTTFYDLKKGAYFWTLSIAFDGFATIAYINYSQSAMTFASIKNGCSVRCVRD